MAPLTRSRAGDGDVQGAMNATYYRQRASAGLIISEATQISAQGKGYAFTPGIYSDDQVAGWRLVTDAVHQAGGRIFAQLWHVGRISHPDLQPGNALPVAPSAVKPEGQAFTASGFKPMVTPRALELEEIPGIIAQYAHAAQAAKRAGFDGVEIHAANGYLLDQFLRDGTNRRTDAYGGSIENRVRLTLEVAAAVAGIWGASRTGIRVSPVTPHAGGITDSNPKALFNHLAGRLSEMGLVYMHAIEGETRGARDYDPIFDFRAFRRAFSGYYIANNGYTKSLAADAIRSGAADLVSFGRPYIANPDLVERLRRNAPLNEGDRETFYGGGAKGYIDYPTLNPEA
ncbi:alkene reductase [Pelagibius sp. 7325]|uniref:alkene reductase n=1 Tax=Pelagibius sp. 7325 TaxID=3131994 RepID=UPI00351D16EA